MGITTLIIAVAFLLFAIIFIVPVLGNLETATEDGLVCAIIPQLCPETTEETERFKDEVKKQETEADLRLPNSDNRQLCNLTVEVDAQLEAPFGQSPYVTIDTSDPANYQWDCQFPYLNTWIDKLSLTPLDFIALESEFIHAEIVLIDKDNPTKKYDANHPDFKSMYREIRITDTTGIVKTPLNLDQSFVIENIVYDDYILEIYYGRTINNLNAGEPVIDKVCTVGNNC
ncbi:MAG: hypothetical protein HOD60_12695 [Candidatus Nitrosopelagicus sp.]|mgnify:FL=1|nr:hypothetical protein [Candidatus Nitrosopelagicus sp.]